MRPWSLLVKIITFQVALSLCSSSRPGWCPLIRKKTGGAQPRSSCATERLYGSFCGILKYMYHIDREILFCRHNARRRQSVCRWICPGAMHRSRRYVLWAHGWKWRSLVSDFEGGRPWDNRWDNRQFLEPDVQRNIAPQNIAIVTVGSNFS